MYKSTRLIGFFALGNPANVLFSRNDLITVYNGEKIGVTIMVFTRCTINVLINDLFCPKQFQQLFTNKIAAVTLYPFLITILLDLLEK